MRSTGYVLLQDESNDLSQVLHELRIKEELLDVTLACEDETIEAHKVVLSASSLFFKSIFIKTKQPHPFIYLRGVFYKDLVALLDYIYTGKAQIASDDVNRFIQVGRDLKVKSLSSEENDDSVSNENITEAIHQVEAVIDRLSPKVLLDENMTNAVPEIKNENASYDMIQQTSVMPKGVIQDKIFIERGRQVLLHVRSAGAQQYLQREKEISGFMGGHPQV